MRACSSMVEHGAYTSAVLGSNPSAPTSFIYFYCNQANQLYQSYALVIHGLNLGGRIINIKGVYPPFYFSDFMLKRRTEGCESD